MRIEILSSASQDLIDAYWFYEKQSDGIGEYYLNSLFSDIDSLLISAGVHPIFFNKYHRLLSNRFPFAIYYRVENETAKVYAVLDTRQNPENVKERLSN